MTAPLSTRQIALLFKDLVHYVLGASGTAFTNNFRWSAFLSSFTPTRISKVHASWWLKQTRNFKDFLHTLYSKLLLSILERYRPGKQFFLRSGHLYFYTFQSPTTVYFSAVSNNLSNWCHEQFFSHQHYTKRIQSSAHGTSSLMTSSLTFARFVSVLSRFSAHSCSRLVASPTSPQIYEHILALKRNSLKLHVFFCSGRRLSSLTFSSTVYLLLWILTCLTWA